MSVLFPSDLAGASFLQPRSLSQKESLSVVESVCSGEQVKFPYIPTFLSSREGPAIVNSYRKLKNRPDILMVDGAGINHPRRAGIVKHVGVALDVPTIGITKKILCAPGHRVSLESSLSIVSSCLRWHKLPEPARLAHLYANEEKKKWKPL